MAIQAAIIVSTILLFSSSVFAREGITTNHSHDGRAHEHPLPAEGLNHNHKYKAPEHKAPTWIVVHKSSTPPSTPYFWLAQKGSLVVINGKRTVLIKRVGGPEPEVKIINKVSVTNSDCGKKGGVITNTTILGAPVRTAKFIFGQKKVPNSSMAEYICRKAQ